MDAIGPTIEAGLLLEFDRKLHRGLGSAKLSLSGLQSVTDSVLGSCQIQKHFAGVTDRHRLKFGVMFLLHGNRRIHPLRNSRKPRPSEVLSSPDHLHRLLRVRNRNRGMNRSGLISEATSHVLD